MGRVLITGISGTGKSTVIERIAAAGHRAVDLDGPEWSHVVAVDGDELTGIGGGEDWVWREDHVRELLADEAGDLLFVSGTSPNQGQFYERFDAVILLSCAPDVMVDRLATRTTNDFGKRPNELARIMAIRNEIEPLLRRGATHEIDTASPLDDVVAAIIRIGRVGDSTG
ncbi:MAG TPA: AAA family ATPase [Thermomicrobiales bacterium]|nr:AAA family ATPase [Thermomicrobiales bacterium]